MQSVDNWPNDKQYILLGMRVEEGDSLCCIWVGQ